MIKAIGIQKRVKDGDEYCKLIFWIVKVLTELMNISF